MFPSALPASRQTAVVYVGSGGEPGSSLSCHPAQMEGQ